MYGMGPSPSSRTLKVATGQVIAPSLGPHPHRSRLRGAHRPDGGRQIPRAPGIFHHRPTQYPPIRKRWSAGLPTSVTWIWTWGRRAKRAFCTPRPPAPLFLQDPSHRIRFVYTPVHTSWLNQVENLVQHSGWPLAETRRLHVTEDLKDKPEQGDGVAFIRPTSIRTMAKPFHWTYTGRPLTA